MSSRPKKKPRAYPPRRSRRIAGQLNATISHLDDVLPNIFGFLHYDEIMSLRCVCKKWKEAAKNTLVPLESVIRGPASNSVLIGNDYPVGEDYRSGYNKLRVLTTALPQLQEIRLGKLGHHVKYSDGDDPDEEEAAITADWTSHDIEIISSFSKLRILEMYHLGPIEGDTLLNGRYPTLFNSFPLLQELHIIECGNLKWDLDMLAGMPLLRVLVCCASWEMTGNIRSLRVLKDTLETVHINDCNKVAGSIMELSDFPNLKVIDLLDTAVTGDIRDIREHDFKAVKEFDLPKTVYGGLGYELQRISDGHDLAKAFIFFKKQRPPSVFRIDWHATLSRESPDWYESEPFFDFSAPLSIRLVRKGSRYGYCWSGSGRFSRSCDVIWVDPEPDQESCDYAEYIEELQEYDRRRDRLSFYKGFKQPPTEEEYRTLCEEYRETYDDPDDY